MKDDCERCGMSDGFHLLSCPAGLGSPWVRPGRELLSNGDRLLVAGLMGAAMVVVALVVVTLFGGCHVGELAAPCDTATLETVKAECRTAVRARCSRVDGVVDEACPTLLECSERIQRWRACSTDGGVQ